MKLYTSLSFHRAPTAGGQYHWVSEFAPRKYQKFLSYITGMYSYPLRMAEPNKPGRI